VNFGYVYILGNYYVVYSVFIMLVDLFNSATSRYDAGGALIVCLVPGSDTLWPGY
jgi:hypothetical protein